MTRWLRRYCTANSECHLGRRSAGCWALVVLSLFPRGGGGRERGGLFLVSGNNRLADSQTSRQRSRQLSTWSPSVRSLSVINLSISRE